MICRAVNGNEGGTHAVRTTALPRAAGHHSDFDIRLTCQTTDGTGYNLPAIRPELKGRGCSQIWVLALLLAAKKTSQDKGKKSHQCTIRHAAILP